MKGIADTGFLVAFANRTDEHHDWAVSLAELVTEPWLTCEPVIAEAVFHLQSALLVLAMIREGLIKLKFGGQATQLPNSRALNRRFDGQFGS